MNVTRRLLQNRHLFLRIMPFLCSLRYFRPQVQLAGPRGVRVATILKDPVVNKDFRISQVGQVLSS